MDSASKWVSLTWASDDRLFAREAPPPAALSQRMTRLPPQVRRDFDEGVRQGNLNRLPAALSAYSRALDALPEALRPVLPEMVLELELGRAKCFIALGQHGAAAQALSPFFSPERALRQVSLGMAIDFLGMLGETLLVGGNPTQGERCISVMIGLTGGQPMLIQMAAGLRARFLSRLLQVAPPDAVLDVLDHQQVFFGKPEADLQGSGVRLQALVTLGRLGAARAFVEARTRFLRSQNAPAEMLEAAARSADDIPSGPGTDPSLMVMSSRSLRRLAEGPVGEELMSAGHAGDLAALERLTRKSSGVDVAGPGFRTALHMAALGGQTAAVSWLLDHGADIEATTQDSRTPLMLAADEGQAKGVALLLDRGARVNSRDFALQTALHLAAWQNHLGTLEVLLAHGASLTCHDVGGCTPLQLACTEDVPEAVSLLLRAGSHIEDVTPAGRTPLMAAAMEGKLRVVQVLLDAGADTHARDAEGRTALDWARLQEHREVAKCLASVFVPRD